MSRIEKLISIMPQEFEAAIVTSFVNRFYLLGMKSSAGTLIVLKDKAYFIIDFRYIELAQKTVKGAEIILQEKLYDQVNEILAKHGVKNVWVEKTMSLAEYNSLTKVLGGVNLCLESPLSSCIDEIRAIKSLEELEIIKTCQKFTDAGFAHMCEVLAAGKTEKEMANELDHYMRLQGADEVAFNILVSGKNSSLPHGVPSQKVIEKGDFVTMDFGARYAGYCTDMTRTVAIGHATEEMKDVYNTVLDAHMTALNMIKPGVCCGDVDKAARDLIDAKYPGRFGHGLGHAVGIEVHEAARFGIGSKDILREGMVMTVEPGIYIPEKFGVRIEDTVY
ncbi:MAG: aminopeptidase P family protein, partial [Oscillospiraceae bacterium]|nr:aminopeptidase P family protein [Oscillospiraceae bacterium]